MPNITIQKITENDFGWECTVLVSENNSQTEHLVTVRKDTYLKLTGKQHTPEELVIKSFEFLLEREPKESILREFTLDIIGQYFPEWEKEMLKRLA